jgi:hypothetical protein
MQNPSHFEQTRITQLLSTYSPYDPPRLLLDFGDYLSLAWRVDRCAALPSRAKYYRACMNGLASAMNFKTHALHKLVGVTPNGEVYRQIPNLPYRGNARLVDALDRKAAISQLITLRDRICEIGTYEEAWGAAYPGIGIEEPELRERVYAVLLTALEGQYGNFARLLLVIDIVLRNLLIGFESMDEYDLPTLIKQHGYPDPASGRVIREYEGDDQVKRG